jgi:hypothetical protein
MIEEELFVVCRFWLILEIYLSLLIELSEVAKESWVTCTDSPTTLRF